MADLYTHPNDSGLSIQSLKKPQSPKCTIKKSQLEEILHKLDSEYPTVIIEKPNKKQIQIQIMQAEKSIFNNPPPFNSNWRVIEENGAWGAEEEPRSSQQHTWTPMSVFNPATNSWGLPRRVSPSNSNSFFYKKWSRKQTQYSDFNLEIV